jgi:hypothetical protein
MLIYVKITERRTDKHIKSSEPHNKNRKKVNIKKNTIT